MEYPVWYIDVVLFPPSNEDTADIDAVADIITGNAGELITQTFRDPEVFRARGTFEDDYEWNNAVSALKAEAKEHTINIELMWWKEMIVQADEGHWRHDRQKASEPYTPEPTVEFEEE